jgi:CDP-diacylglycerol--glycerol-3-phosphate 3-phosphatidyltransferase
MRNRNYYIINSLTFYRLFSAPLLIILAITHQLLIFRWLLAFSFFTDLIDGALARHFKVTSVLGSRVDSVADDLTVAAGVTGLYVFKGGFMKENGLIILVLIILFVVQTGMALIKYRRTTSFHTYLAKLAAIFQGVFLILTFFSEDQLYWLFYPTVAITALDLTEEIILVLVLREWRPDVGGIFTLLKKELRK